jgi:hypothetical protein
MKRPPFFRPELEWQGPQLQPLRGKRIAIYAEQGLGDVIQFIRYARMLQADGAAVFCVIQPQLVPLVEHSFEGVQCLTPQRQFQVDYHVALLDLSMRYGTTLENIPASGPYLRVHQDKRDHWRDRIVTGESMRVGLAWSGSQTQVNNVNRAMRLSHLSPITEMEGVQCFSLQKTDVGALTDVVPTAGSLIDLTADWHDFTDSAAMLQNLDLVVTVDTAVAHLAGALGIEVWVLLPPNADWRWLLDRDDSPWYPTMRLFRRGFGEARATQVGRVVTALKERLAAHALAQVG